MENCVFKKIYLEDNKPVRVHVVLSENSIELILLQNENAWKSFVNTENVKRFAKQHKLTLENYCEKLLDYIRTADSDIIFIINENEFFINRLLNKSLKVKYFSCNLEKVNYVEHVEQIMDKFYSENSKYLEELQSAIKEKNEINECKTNCELKLKELIEKKTADEDDQFGKFVLILNEKKRRIQHLTELLEAFKGGRPTVNPPVVVKSRKKKHQKNIPSVVKKVETISASEASESSNSNTDDENYATQEKSPLNEDCKPSTSAETYDFLRDDIPESCVLPKRVKYESNISDMTAPTTSKSSPPKEEENEPQNTETGGSPTIDINTQQLLDML